MGSEKPYDYSEYSAFNRFQNLDSIEWKIINHLLNSDTKYARLFWKLLKDNSMRAPVIDDSEITDEDPVKRRKKRISLVCQGDNGDLTTKRVFLSPFIDDAWTEQCSSVYIYVKNIYPTNHMQSTIEVAVETVTHSKITVVVPEAEEEKQREANPNDFNSEGNLIIGRKNRETLLLKCVLAELNGLYLDGIGYLQFNAQGGLPGKVEKSLFNNRSFYGHSTTFCVRMGNVSEGGTDEPYDPFDGL